MEKLIKITTENERFNTSIEIDNSTDFKDFIIEQKEILIKEQDSNEKKLDINFDTTENHLVINNIILEKREIELLKEFLNQ